MPQVIYKSKTAVIYWPRTAVSIWFENWGSWVRVLNLGVVSNKIPQTMARGTGFKVSSPEFLLNIPKYFISGK